ncbi:MAG: TRAP transporter small permease subunit [Deltaproteobacteria bacterium]|nr:TRAP transporter small permease subunit [Deltaproteobacteria bacterium]
MLKRILSNSVEWVCMVLMVVLSMDLLLGVFSRYVLVRTFTWYDEIARSCFVWLTFLGAAVGVKRQAHFRLLIVVDRLSPRLRQATVILLPL